MKALFTIADLQPESGGPSFSVTALTFNLARLGLEVELLAHEYGQGRRRPLVPPAPVRTVLVPCRGRLAGMKWTREFGQRLRNSCRSCPIVHDTGVWLWTNHAAARASREFGLARIVSPRGMLSNWALGHKGLKKQLAWRLYQKHDLQTAQVLHATSAAEAEEFRALGLKQAIAIVPNGVELPPAIPPSASLRGSDAKTRSILFLSRIHPKKGLLNFVEAWARIKSGAGTGGNWKVVIAGGDEGGHAQEVKSETVRLKVQNDFEFTGPVEGQAKWDLYQSADLFVLPSHSENFGLVVAEALACGVPVITTRGTPWKDLVTNHCGWWVAARAETLAAALAEAMTLSDKERREMGKRGRTLVEQKYGWPAIGIQMKSVYEWMLGTAPKPECVLNG